MSITLTQICDAIATTLGAATGLTYTQSIDEITEGMVDMPAIQVYWEALTQDPGGGTDRRTMVGGKRVTVITIHVDLYAEQRAHVGQNLQTATDLVDAINDVFEQQDTKPYFGLDGIQAFQWNATRAIFDYAGHSFMGTRFVLTVTVF